jgi:hypothetical protein
MTKVTTGNKKTETKKTETTTTETKMQDLKAIKLTEAEFDALDAAGLRAKLCDEPQLRISRERGKEFLVSMIAAGKVNSITPEALMNWTYKAVTITGVALKGQGFTAEKAKKTLTKEAFAKLDAQGKADLIKEYTNKRRAADIIIPDLVTAGMPLTKEDVVYLTCGRIEIEGVTIAAKARKSSPAITEGVTFE